MAMNAPAPGGGGATIAGIPVKWALIGGGGLVVAFLMTRGSGSKAPATEADPSQAGQVLGPNASLAVGDLNRQFQQKIGDTQELTKGYYSDIMEQLQAQQHVIGDVETGINQRISDADFWQRAQQGANTNNIRASLENWTPLQWAQNSKIYAQQLISQRPDLEGYFRDNWESQFGANFDWGSIVSSAPS